MMIMSADIPETEIPWAPFYPCLPEADPGLHRHPQLGPMLCGVALRPLAQVGFWVVDADNRHVAMPPAALKLSPTTAANKLGAELTARCLEGRRLRDSASAKSLRSWLPTLVKLSRLSAPLAHNATVRAAINRVLDAMIKAGELKPATAPHLTAA